MVRSLNSHCMITVLLLSSICVGAEWFVATDGDNENAGDSWEQALASIPEAVSRAGAGDTINVGSGTFSLQTDLFLPGGVTLAGQGMSGENATILTGTWSNDPSEGMKEEGFLIHIEDADAVVVRDLAFDGDDRIRGAVYAENSDNVILRNVYVYDTTFMGIWLQEGSNIEVDGCRLVNCSWDSEGYASGMLCISNITDSRIHHTTFDGLTDTLGGAGISTLGWGDHIRRVLIDHVSISVPPYAMWDPEHVAEENTMNFSMSLDKMECEEIEIRDSFFNMGWTLTGLNRYQGSSHAIWAHHNYFQLHNGRIAELKCSRVIFSHNFLTGPESGVAMFEGYGDGTIALAGVKIHHNIMMNVRSAHVLRAGYRYPNLKLCNNTILYAPHPNRYDRDTPYLLYSPGSDHDQDTWTVKNNLILSRDDRLGEIISRWWTGTEPDLDIGNNLAQYFEHLGSNNITDDPQLPLDGEQPAPWFQPPNGSPAIDDGAVVSGITDNAVGTPDIGAFEHGASTNRFMPDDFSWTLHAAVASDAGSQGLAWKRYNLPSNDDDMPMDSRDMLDMTPASGGLSTGYDNTSIISGTYKGVIFEGYMKAPATGRYRFWLGSQGFSRLQIHGKDLLENDGSRPGGHYDLTVSDSIHLQAGIHPIRIFYMNGSNTMEPIRLQWQVPGQSIADVPAAVLGQFAGTISLSTAAATVGEDAGAITFTVTRRDCSQGAVTVDYATSDGSAQAGSDYTTQSGTLEWADGNTDDKIIEISIEDDNNYESNETFTLTLSNASGSPAIDLDSASITIVDNDEAGTITLPVAAIDVLEGSEVSVAVERNGGVDGEVSVYYETIDQDTDNDYTDLSGTLTWPHGDAEDKTILINITDDSEVESDERFKVFLSSPTGGATIGNDTETITILGNDVPTSNPPVITNGPNADPTTVTIPAGIALDVTATDADNDTLNYAWVKASGPGVVLFSAQAANTVATFDSAGNYTLQVTVNDGNGGSDTATVNVTVEAAPTTGDGRIAVTGNTDFGTTYVEDGSVVRTHMITNSGTGLLLIESIGISGTDAAAFSITAEPAVSLVGAGLSTTFDITFDPSSEGSKEATLTIDSDDPENDTIILDLGGEALAGTTPALPPPSDDDDGCALGFGSSNFSTLLVISIVTMAGRFCLGKSSRVPEGGQTLFPEIGKTAQKNKKLNCANSTLHKDYALCGSRIMN